jgi:hypothetical protein
MASSGKSAAGEAKSGAANKPQPSMPAKKKSKGQRISRARGSATNHKKNPGKRAHSGGS